MEENKRYWKYLSYLAKMYRYDKNLALYGIKKTFNNYNISFDSFSALDNLSLWDQFCMTTDF